MRRRRELARTLATPGLLALCSSAGLVLALVGDGTVDFVACAAIAVPLVATVRAWSRRRR
jgi:membrane protein implicated in regulation of membrane protease activity